MSEAEKSPITPPERRKFISAFFLGWYNGQESILVDAGKGVIPMFGCPSDPSPAVFIDQVIPQLCGSECVDVREAGEVETVPMSLVIITGTVVSPNSNSRAHIWRWTPISNILHRRTFTDMIVAWLRSGIEDFRLVETGDRAGWYITFPKKEQVENKSGKSPNQKADDAGAGDVRPSQKDPT